MTCRPLAGLLLRRAWPQTRGKISGLPLRGSAEVIRDRWGIPHISAGSLHDVFAAQGFVHAQDRLWQMESMRRLSEGRLSEVAGEPALPVDCLARAIGMPFMKRQMLAAATEEERGVLEAYAEGVNGYLGRQGRDLPLEFRSMGFTPEPWTAVDCLSTVPFMSLSLVFAAYTERLLALVRGSSLSLREWNDMFPVSPGAALPREPYFESLAHLRMGPLQSFATAFHAGLPDRATPAVSGASPPNAARPGAGSNNWVVARGADGAPLLANDPHLGVTLPPVWYFCHLCVAGVMNVAGSSLAGIPGIVIGRNEHVAWGMTNVMLDAIDVLVLRVDPDHPTRYDLAGERKEMCRQDMEFRLPKGRSVSVPIYRTERGPVITAVEEGIGAVAALRWCGTLPDGTLRDRSFGGLLSSLRARSAAEVLDGGRTWGYVSQNLVAADDQGHIGWQVTGAVPVRAGYSGRLPADGSSGADWTGFVSPDLLPRVMDPPRGWLATANCRPEGFPDGIDDGRPLSYSWCGPYRYQRIAHQLPKMRAPRAEDFRRLQMDVHSTQADRLLPRVLAFTFADSKAAEGARILAGWDREVTAVSSGAALYEVFLAELEKELLEERLGPDFALYPSARMYSIVDEILERPDSPFWGTGSGPEEKVGRALARAMEICARRLGAARRGWKWGTLHRLVFHHPGATSPFLASLLNPAPAPAGGDMNTLNASWSSPVRDSYEVATIPSMRMVTSLGDPDSLQMVGPLGQSGQPGHPHYDDLLAHWRDGELVPIPLTRPAVERIARETLTLEP